MPYSRPEIRANSKALFAQNQRIAASPRLLQTSYERSVRGLRQDFVRELGTPLGAHKRPTLWQSDKQRRWWFAVGVKTWTGRTGELEKGWKTDLKTTDSGGLFRYWNVKDYWVFVQGWRAQRMHQGTWRLVASVVPRFAALANERLRQAWHTVVDSRAGVR